MRQKQKTTLRFISDIHIHAIYESGKKTYYFHLHLEQFWGYIYNIRDIVQKEMLKYYVVSFKHDLSPLPLLSFSSALRFCLLTDGSAYTSWIQIQSLT